MVVTGVNAPGVPPGTGRSVAGPPGLLILAFDTGGQRIFGVQQRVVEPDSLCVGAVPVVEAVIGGNIASTWHIGSGVAFVLSGFVNPGVTEAGRVPSEVRGFAVGPEVMTFGRYGHVSGGPPENNPCRRTRGADPYVAPRRRATRRVPG